MATMEPVKARELDEVSRAVEHVTAAYPSATVQDRDGYKSATAKQVNQMLNFIYVMLGLAFYHLPAESGTSAR